MGVYSCVRVRVYVFFVIACVCVYVLCLCGMVWSVWYVCASVSMCPSVCVCVCVEGPCLCVCLCTCVEILYVRVRGWSQTCMCVGGLCVHLTLSIGGLWTQRPESSVPDTINGNRYNPKVF